MTMATYVILAKFTDQGIKTAKESPKRAEAFKQMAKTFGVTVKDIFWTQGRYDIVAITEAPDELTGTALNLSLWRAGQHPYRIAASLFGRRHDEDRRKDGLTSAISPTLRCEKMSSWKKKKSPPIEHTGPGSEG